MAPRQRKPSNAKLPDNVRERDGYYSWRHPITKQEFGLGRDQDDAFDQAIEANLKLAGEIVRPRLVERLEGTESRTWGKWCDEFEKLLKERESAANTKRQHGVYLKRLRAAFDAGRPGASITTLDCATALNALKDAGKARTAQAFRSFMVDCFDRMIAQGWRTDNPARVTDKVSPKVKRARLSFDFFKRVYESTEIIWLRNAMALAIVAGKDRESVRNALFTDFRDGGWWNERGKTGARVFLPMNLRLNVFGMSLEDVVRQCRSTGVVSRYLIHQTQRAKGARLGMPLHTTMITRKFHDELAKLKIDWGGKEPPTFHEIRSLAARLHQEQGDVDPQQLLSHKDPKSTAVYTDGRGEWVKLSVRDPAV
jgi:integrase